MHKAILSADSLSAIRQQAKRLKKQKDNFCIQIKNQTAALDKLAKIHGYAHWTSALKHSELVPLQGDYQVKDIIGADALTIVSNQSIIHSLIERTALVLEVPFMYALKILLWLNGKENRASYSYLKDYPISFDSLGLGRVFEDLLDGKSHLERHGPSVGLITGRPGTGKSLVLCALLNSENDSQRINFYSPGDFEYGFKRESYIQGYDYSQVNFPPSEGEHMIGQFFGQSLRSGCDCIVIDEFDRYITKENQQRIIQDMEIALHAGISIVFTSQLGINNFYKLIGESKIIKAHFKLWVGTDVKRHPLNDRMLYEHHIMIPMNKRESVFDETRQIVQHSQIPSID